MYGDWAQWERRYRALHGKHKVMFGVGCRVCIPQGYKGCGACLVALPEWQARHIKSPYEPISVGEAGRRIAGL